MSIAYDVVYDSDSPAALLDLHQPDDAGDGLRPGIVVVHGGGWYVGDKSDLRQTQIAELMAAHGYVVININYTLSPTSDNKEPYIEQAFADCRAALRWLLQQAEKLRLDPRRIGAIGGSAGGTMSLMLALCDGDPTQRPIAPSHPAMRAVVNLYAPTTRPAALTVVDHITPQCPPVLTLHGTADQTVDIEHAHALDAAIRSVDASHELIVVEGAPHTFNVISQWGDYSQQIIDFFDSHLR